MTTVALLPITIVLGIVGILSKGIVYAHFALALVSLITGRISVNYLFK